jgi:hypothetical protein
MTPHAKKLSVKNRLALIPPAKKAGEEVSLAIASRNAVEEAHTHARPGEAHKDDHQPGNPEIEYLPYRIEHELEICRKYMMDFVCFDYGIPASCIKYAKEVYS